MSNKERKKEISKQPIPTIEECLGFYKELTNLADARFVPYYKMAIKALEQEPCEDCVSREQLNKLYNEYRPSLATRVCEFGEKLKELPSVKLATDNNVLTCEDAVSREEVTQSRPEWLSEDVERDTDVQTVVDRAFNRGWNSCLKEFLKNIKELPSVTPKPKTGHWVLADEQNKEDVENDNYRFICSECQCSDIHSKGTKVPYCWKCGAKMESEE